MSTIAVEMAIKKPTKADAEAELEDLDVREVSIVDRPANKRKFLIVKRDAGRAQEEDMQTEVIKNDTGLLELLGLGLTDDNDEGSHVVSDPDAQPDLEAIAKGSVQETAKAVAALVGRLTKVVNGLKGSGDKGDAEKADAPPPTVKELVAIADALVDLVTRLGQEGPEKQAAQKADAGTVLKTASGALTSLMEVAAKLKEIGDGDTVPAALIGKMKSAAESLRKVAGGADAAEPSDADKAKKDPTTKSEGEKPEFQVFTSGQGDDPEIIIKAGAKMKKARLNQFKKAVETLMSLLKELEGDQGGPKDAKDKKSVSKSDEPNISEALAKGFELLEGRLTEKLDGAVKDLTEKVEAVTKRVDEVETGVVPGKGDADPTETKKDEVKKSQGFWSSVFKG